MMLTLVLTNSAATAAALCQHDSVDAHVSARQSSQADVAAGAIIEEAAAAAANKDGASADTGALQSSLYVLPSDPVVPAPALLALEHRRPADATQRAGRAADRCWSHRSPDPSRL
jgi:hypothetical protein